MEGVRLCSYDYQRMLTQVSNSENLPFIDDEASFLDSQLDGWLHQIAALHTRVKTWKLSIDIAGEYTPIDPEGTPSAIGVSGYSTEFTLLSEEPQLNELYFMLGASSLAGDMPLPPTLDGGFVGVDMESFGYTGCFITADNDDFSSVGVVDGVFSAYNGGDDSTIFIKDAPTASNVPESISSRAQSLASFVLNLDPFEDPSAPYLYGSSSFNNLAGTYIYNEGEGSDFDAIKTFEGGLTIKTSFKTWTHPFHLGEKPNLAADTYTFSACNIVLEAVEYHSHDGTWDATTGKKL